MAFWNYIGEFFLFRWLLGKFRKSTIEHDTHTEVAGASINGNSEYQTGNHDEDIVPDDDAATSAGDNLFDDSDSSEELDDLDIFMRNNRSSLHHGDYDSDYRSRSNYSPHNDWDSGSYSHSYDDFHEEQDDYDMMDDEF